MNKKTRSGNYTRTWLRRIICTLLVGSMICSQTVPAWASSKVEKEKKEAQKNLDDAKKKEEDAKAKKNAATAQVSKLTSDLTALLSDIQILESDMAAKEADIKKAEKDYDKAKAEEADQYASMKKRIQYMYEKGDTEYLDIFLHVKNMSDLLNKAEYVENIYSYDRKMLDKYRDTKNQVSDYKDQLEEDKNEMQVMELELTGQKTQLESTIATKKKEVSNFDSQMAQAQKDAAIYTQTVEKKNEEIRKANAEAARKKAEADAQRKAASSNKKPPVTNNVYSGPGAMKSSGGSARGREIADYALRFLGNPYVYGGTSLTNGTDCSGFVQQVFGHFNYSLPRTSTEQRNVGREVAYSDAQPGDIICYAGHVAIYIGNGQIVHASTPATGIKIGNATYRTILTIRRVV